MPASTEIGDLLSNATKCRGTCFPAEVKPLEPERPNLMVLWLRQVTTHTGRVQIAESMKTHTELVENAMPRVLYRCTRAVPLSGPSGGQSTGWGSDSLPRSP